MNLSKVKRSFLIIKVSQSAAIWQLLIYICHVSYFYLRAIIYENLSSFKRVLTADNLSLILLVPYEQEVLPLNAKKKISMKCKDTA